MPDPESVRRGVATALQWGGWSGAVFMIAYSTINYDPNDGHFAPAWYGLTFIMLVGVAIAGTTVRSRMRLSDTIVAAMQMGYGLSEDQRRDDE